MSTRWPGRISTAEGAQSPPEAAESAETPSEASEEPEVALDAPEGAESPFRPGYATIEEVKAYVLAHPDEREAIQADEEANRNRVTLLTWLREFNGS